MGGHLAAAQEAPPIARYVPASPDPRHVFVFDSAHVLSDSMIHALQDSALALQTATGADVAWVTLPTLGGRAIEDATVYLGRTWKIGSAGKPGDSMRNRGLLILYVPDKSKTAGSNFRVEVGTGLQGTIIDSRSKSVAVSMRDDLRAKRYDAAYMKGWAVAAAMVREDFKSRGVAAVPARPAPSAAKEPHYSLVPATVLAVLFIGLMLFLMRRTQSAGPPTMVFLPSNSGDDDDDDDDERRRRSSGTSSSSWSSFGDSGSSGSGSGGGDFGGGGGFDGGGSSDSI